MDKLNKRVAAIEARQPPKRRHVTDDDLQRWYSEQYRLGNLQDIDGTVIVNPTLETTALHSRVLASVARAANQARAAKAKLWGEYT